MATTATTAATTGTIPSAPNSLLESAGHHDGLAQGGVRCHQGSTTSRMPAPRELADQVEAIRALLQSLRAVPSNVYCRPVTGGGRRWGRGARSERGGDEPIGEEEGESKEAMAV